MGLREEQPTHDLILLNDRVGSSGMFVGFN